jgi:hypothetical protein
MRFVGKRMVDLCWQVNNKLKHQISAKSEYYGGVKAATEKFTSHQSAYNMRLNPSK